MKPFAVSCQFFLSLSRLFFLHEKHIKKLLHKGSSFDGKVLAMQLYIAFLQE